MLGELKVIHQQEHEFSICFMTITVAYTIKGYTVQDDA